LKGNGLFVAMKTIKTTKLIAAIALRLKNSYEKIGLPITTKEAYRRASSELRIRRSGRAAALWRPGYGRNIPLLALAAGWGKEG